MSSPSVRCCSLRVPGADLYYEVRGSGPLMILVAGPMDARGFASLADELGADHTVVTTDPRGVGRSTVDDPEQERFPQLRADDLARLIRHLGGDPARVLGTCGGAVAALALAQVHPELLHTVIAHEPPSQELLMDRDERRRATEEVVRSSLEAGSSTASVAVHFSVGRAGEPTPQDRRDEQMFLQHELLATTQWLPDVARLAELDGTVRIAVGVDSVGETCGLASHTLAAQLGSDPWVVPGGHLGFLDDPAGFADALRGILALR